METISIKDKNGKIYEFEKPEFECELLKVKNGMIYGIATNHQNSVCSFQWNTAGSIYSTTASSLKGSGVRNLTPVEPKWYEDENNFPALVKFGNQKSFDTVDYYKHEKNEIWNHQGGYYKPKEIRLATKEEVLSLYYKDKE